MKLRWRHTDAKKERKQVTSHRSTYKVAGIHKSKNAHLRVLFVSEVPRNSERDYSPHYDVLQALLGPSMLFTVQLFFFVKLT